MQENRELPAVLCQSLHGGDCTEPIPVGFQFCPVCGRRAVHLVFPDASTDSSTISLVLQPGQTARNVFIANDGPAVASVEIGVRGQGVTPGVRRLAVSGVMQGRPGQKILPLMLETGRTTVGQARLALTTANVTPVQDPWGERAPETHYVQVEWHERRPACLIVLTPALLFHARGGASRLLRIANGGDASLPLILPSLPPGFVFGKMDGLPADLSPGQELSLPIHHRAAPMESGDHTIYFDSPGDAVAFSLVTEEEKAGGIRPDWIIALDFGTSNTSIVARSIPSSGLPADAGQCFPIPGPAGEPRFPSTMLYDARERSWIFGEDAGKETGTGNNFFLIDDRNSLKMNLGSNGEPYLDWEQLKAYPAARGEFTIASLLQTYLRHLRDTVIKPFLSQKPQAHVQYVLSLPVLDGRSGEAFQRQRERMLSCFSRVFDVPQSQVITELEPNCAANHLLIGQGYQYLRQLVGRSEALFAAGDRFIVVDSGGGTTDIAYGEFEEAQRSGGRLQFRVLRNLGLGEKRETFGGRKVSDFFHTELNRQPYGQFHHSPCDVLPKSGESVEDFGTTCSRVSDDIERSIKPTYSAGETPAGLPSELREKLHTFINDNMKSLLDVFRAAISTDTGRKAPRWVFLVGGNTLVHSLEAFCLRRLADDKSEVLPSLPLEERFLAVAMGAAFADGLFAPEFAPHTVELMIYDRDDRPIVAETLQAKTRPLTDHEVTHNLTGAVTLALKADDAEMVSQIVGGPGLTTRLRASVRAGRLTVDAHIAQDADGPVGSGASIVLYDGQL